MKRAILLRLETGDQGTFGVLRSEGFSVFTSELPWRNNESNKSCIPVGVYTCSWKKSPKFGWCYQVLAVPGRGNVLLHSGNYVGNSDLGFRTNSHGCILPALKLGTLAGQKAGLVSVPAVRALNSFFNQEDFILEIKNADSLNITT